MCEDVGSVMLEDFLPQYQVQKWIVELFLPEILVFESLGPFLGCHMLGYLDYMGLPVRIIDSVDPTWHNLTKEASLSWNLGPIFQLWSEDDGGRVQHNNIPESQNNKHYQIWSKTASSIASNTVKSRESALESIGNPPQASKVLVSHSPYCVELAADPVSPWSLQKLARSAP